MTVLLGIIPHALGIALCGLVVAALAGRWHWRPESRLELACHAFLSGSIVSTLLVSWAGYAGAPLRWWLWWCVFVVAALLVAVYWRGCVRLIAGHRRVAGCWLPRGPLVVVVQAVMALAVIWSLFAVWKFPAMDWDSIVIWSYRTQVLYHEESLYAEALRDPGRMLPMLRHPYFLPVLETGFLRMAGRWSEGVRHIPVALAMWAWLGLVWSATARVTGRSARVGLLCATLLPVMVVGPFVESPREALIGFYAFAATLALCDAAMRGQPGGLILAAVYAVGCEQVKVDGLPIFLGTAIVIVGWGVVRRKAKPFGLAAAMGLAVVPWYVFRSAIPASQADYPVVGSLFEHGGGILAGLPPVLWMTVTELFARPELYGVGAFVTVYWLTRSWGCVPAYRRLAVLLPAAAGLAGIITIYAVRQEHLAPERNVTYSRRFMCVMPALGLAAVCGASPIARRRQHSGSGMVPRTG